jgi:hypothetical protein
LGGGGFEAKNFISAGESHAALLRALKVALENQVRFMNLLESTRLFSHRGGEGVESGGATF